MPIYRKFLLLLCTSSCIFLHISSMDEFKAKLDNIKNGTVPVDMEDILQQATELSKNKDNYKRIARLTHPDQNKENKILEQIFKAAKEGDELNRAKVDIAQATPEDIARVNVLNKMDKLNSESKMLQDCSIFSLILINTEEQAEEEVFRNFADNLVRSTFTLLSDKLMPSDPENNELAQEIKSCDQILETLKNNQEAIRNALQIHADYRIDLKESKKRTDQKTQRKLKKLLKKISK